MKKEIGKGYAVRVVGPGGPVKIDFTGSNVGGRIRAAEAACPYPTEWIACWESTKDEDLCLLRKLRPYRLKGEWFHPVDPVLREIKLLCPEFNAGKLMDELFRGASREKFFTFFYRVESRRRVGVRNMAIDEIAKATGAPSTEIAAWVTGTASCSAEVEAAALAWIDQRRHWNLVELVSAADRAWRARIALDRAVRHGAAA